MQDFAPELGALATIELVVTDVDLATAVHTGGVPVLSSPRLFALMEEAAVCAVEPFLSSGWQTVGIHLDVRHTAATPPGRCVAAQARLVQVDGRRLVFDVCAHDAAGEIGAGVHERFLVETDRFLRRAGARFED